MSNENWKNLERTCAKHFDSLLREKADLLGIKVPDEPIVRRNLRGANFSKADSDIDVVYPAVHNMIGGPHILEAKYRKQNTILRSFLDFAKTRPNSSMIPAMLLHSKGSIYVMRKLSDYRFKELLTTENEPWNIWITSKNLSKNNKYLEDWMKQAEEYIPTKAEEYNLDTKDFVPLVCCSSYRTPVVCIQRVTQCKK
jgi:hypothetical protein